ncbi:hypothetical protein B0H12DRAFT_229374 [Mycena haematopus]|nr:hypothetical protein B0H12DRAFT_229374 [Mycena haematopus]
MCWPRNFCCRCPRPSSWVLRPPSLMFWKTPRRPAVPQPMFPMSFSPGYHIPLHDSPPNARRGPVIPSNVPSPRQGPVIPRRLRRRVQFADDGGPPPLVHAPNPPFIPPVVMSPMPWAHHQHVNPELCTPRGGYPFLDWDLRHFPSSARLRSSPTTSTDPAFTSPATYPHTQLLTISYAETPVLHHWEHHWGPIFARGQGAASRTAGRRAGCDIPVL